MNVAEYESSDAWRAMREHYRASDRPQDCFICGLRETSLHHRTYERMGHEDLDDLVPLCQDHHWEVEKLVKWRGVKRWDAHVVYRECLDARTDHAPRPFARIILAWVSEARPLTS